MSNIILPPEVREKKIKEINEKVKYFAKKDATRITCRKCQKNTMIPIYLFENGSNLISNIVLRCKVCKWNTPLYPEQAMSAGIKNEETKKIDPKGELKKNSLDNLKGHKKINPNHLGGNCDNDEPDEIRKNGVWVKNRKLKKY